MANSRKRGSGKSGGGHSDEIDNVSAKAAKLTDIAAVNTGKTDEALLNALTVVHQATKDAIVFAKERLHTVNESYFCGVKIGHNPRVLEELNTLSQSTSTLDSLTKEIGHKVNGAPCYKLPAETMYKVFSYLDMDALARCRDTCTRWRDLLDQEAAHRQSWRDVPVDLHGTPTEIMEKWNAYRAICPSPSSMSMKIVKDALKTNYSKGGEVETMLTELKIPLDGIQKFVFEKVHSFGDREVWDRILQCPRLQILHWSYHGDPKDDLHYPTPNYRKVSPLCQLEEIRFDVVSDFRFDEEVLDQLGHQLKRFYHIQGLERKRFLRILDDSQWTLEELIVANLHRYRVSDFYGILTPVPDPTLIMNRLNKIWVQECQMGVLHIRAPNATCVRFDHGYLIDWTLIDSCRSKIKSLHLETKGRKTDGRLGQEIFDMPQLEELHLDHRREPYEKTREDPKGRVTDYALYSTAAFWQAVCSNDVTKIESILPRLKKLTIIHDPLLDETNFLKYMSLRALANHPVIEEMNICLANNQSMNVEQLKSLCSQGSGLRYKSFDQWGNQETRQWSLLDGLVENGRFVAWDLIDACRAILRSLNIRLGSAEDEERIDLELFILPQLEHLVLDFSRMQHSATALWKALSTGITENDNVQIQDILPKLEKLRVINDGTLDEEKIIKMIAIRENIGLCPLKSIQVDLAKELFKKDCAKVDELKERNSGFSYGCYTCWQDY